MTDEHRVDRGVVMADERDIFFLLFSFSKDLHVHCIITGKSGGKKKQFYEEADSLQCRPITLNLPPCQRLHQASAFSLCHQQIGGKKNSSQSPTLQEGQTGTRRTPRPLLIPPEQSSREAFSLSLCSRSPRQRPQPWKEAFTRHLAPA